MGFCDIPVVNSVCDAADAIDFVSDPGGSITDGIGSWIAKSTGEMASSAVEMVAETIDKTTAIDLNAAWFRENYELILPIGLTVLVGTFIAQLVRAAMKRDGRALAQAFTGTASGVLFSFSVIALTTVAIEVTDALSAGLFAAADTSLKEAVQRVVSVGGIASLATSGWLLTGLCAIIAAIGVFMFWCVMLVRKVGILIMVTLAVFAGAGGGWEVARRWRKGWIEATAVLVFSKLLMTIVFLLGISALGNTRAQDGAAALSDVLAGIVIMLLVCLCPYTTFKFVHWAAEGTNGEEIHRAGGAGSQVARQYAERAAKKAASAAATAGSGGAGAAAGAEAVGPEVPGQFPGDIAAHPTGGGGDDDSSGSDPLKKGFAPPPTDLRENASGQSDGPPSSGAGPDGPQWGAPTSTSPPPSNSAASDTSSAVGPAAPPPSPTGT
ncbi:ATP-binding protein [Streptomyces sp. NPDC051561]|uniref:SCO6881 family protein n=1 Tax=Streptomyces sp. NPDC051561 TaxID=3365658 RepID=UPI00379E63D2